MTQVKITTPLGEIVVALYDDTPQHRDNFIRLVNEGYYNGTLFHRVISEFMIQGGDPDSRGAAPEAILGVGGPTYTLPAEILPHRIHKRGALAAARQGDEVNPERRSSGSQFYIVWGKTYNDGQLQQLERQLKLQAEQQCFQRLAAERKEEIMELRRHRDREGLQALQEELAAKAQAEARLQGGLSEAAREAYKSVGGVPFLDGSYTVFGEVVSGLEVVEAIQQVDTNAQDRPLTDLEMVATIIDAEA